MITHLKNTLKKLLRLDQDCPKTSVPEISTKLTESFIQDDRETPIELSAASEHPSPRRSRRSRSRSTSNARRRSAGALVQNATVIMPPLVEVPPEPGKRRFADFDIATEVLSGIQDLGFQYCTPIQEQCLPHALAGRDITGRAQTGTGKTAAFLTAILTYLLRNPKKGRKPGSCRVLVLAPTRELAIQIFDDAQALGKYCGFENLVVFGGMGYQKQREALQKPIDILVGTPGRVIDYSTSGHLDLSKTEIVVIDEADRMLDMGFIPDVRRIVQKAPPPGKRQTMFFSATLTSEIISLVDRWLINPVRIETETENVVTDLIEQTFYSVSCSDKLALILWILKNDSVKRMLVFCNRKDSAQKLASALQRHGIQSGVLSGDIPQEKRLRILDEFRNDKKSVIVATDVAARGIHVDSVSHVVLYDLPQDPEAYVHRVGRTGRAGETGKSIGFACEYGAHLIPELEQFLGCRIACINPTEEMLVLPAMPAGTSTIKTVNADSRPSRHNRSRRSWRVKPSSVPKSTA